MTVNQSQGLLPYPKGTQIKSTLNSMLRIVKGHCKHVILTIIGSIDAIVIAKSKGIAITSNWNNFTQSKEMKESVAIELKKNTDKDILAIRHSPWIRYDEDGACDIHDTEQLIMQKSCC